MSFIDTAAMGENLHRLAKLALDSGEVATVQDALALFQTYALHIAVGPDLRGSPARQAALLTAMNTGRRAFLGGVTVSGDLAVPLCVDLPGPADLAAAIQQLGGDIVDGDPGRGVAIAIGSAAAPRGLRTVARGWAGGCAPVGAGAIEDDPAAFVLAGIAAGALAVSESFQIVRRSNPAAGRRSVGISLWQPGLDWRDAASQGLPVALLPEAAWLIGLGNLGQAYLWALGLLPYAQPDKLHLVLQDFDRIAPSNDSTSILTDMSMVGMRKTRAMAAWAERRGFTTSLIERPFDRHFALSADDPAIALCGVDNALARSALEDVGFARVIEAGLGNGVSDFLALRLHSFPAKSRARDIWGNAKAASPAPLDQPAYQALAEKGAERCGLVQLAGRTVGAPFVGALAGSLVVAELVRMANGGPSTAMLDMHLRSPHQLHAVLQPESFAFNPGGTLVRIESDLP